MYYLCTLNKTSKIFITIMTTFINNNIDSALSNLNMAYHIGVSELNDFTVKCVGNDKYKLITLSYNGWNKPVETELTSVPVSECELVKTMCFLADKYWNMVV